jgi:hypothetical protein
MPQSPARDLNNTLTNTAPISSPPPDGGNFSDMYVYIQALRMGTTKPAASIKPKTKRKPSEYNLFMAKRVAEMKAHATKSGVPYVHKKAFVAIAAEWSAQKKK